MVSYLRGPDYPLLEITIGQQLRRTADRVGDSLALASCHQSRRLPWGKLDNVTDRLARGLWSIGIRKTDRVGVWSSNCIEWVILQMACARAGAILVNMNPAYRSHELRFTLSKSRLKAIFLWHSDARADYEAILQEAAQGQSLELGHTIYFDSPRWEELLNAARFPRMFRHKTSATFNTLRGLPGFLKG